MAEVVLDANVLVAWLDGNDVHHTRAREVIERLEAEGRQLVLLDVNCRRGRVRALPSGLFNGLLDRAACAFSRTGRG